MELKWMIMKDCDVVMMNLTWKYYTDNSVIVTLSLNATTDKLRINMNEERFNLLFRKNSKLTVVKVP